MPETITNENEHKMLARRAEIELRREGSAPAIRGNEKTWFIRLPDTPIYAPIAKLSRLTRSRLLMSFVGIVILLPLCYGAYLAFFASSRYTTEFRVAVKSADSMQQVGLSALLGLGLGGATSNTYDSNAIVQYIKSLQGVGDIDKDIGLIARYSTEQIDFASRLDTAAPVEKILRYWNKMLKAYYETSTGTIIVKVDAFTPQDSLDIASSALNLSEKLVNDMSARARNEAVAFAQQEVSKAEQRLARATERMTEVMDREGTLNPQLSAQSIVTSSTRLRDELSELNAKLTVQRASLSEDAPPVSQTKRQIAAIEAELSKLNALATGSNKGDNRPLSASLSNFTKAESERMFAEKAYQSALTALETARIDAARRQAYLATIVRPQLAEERSYPRVLLATTIAVAVCFLVWVIGTVTIFAVKEHM